MDKNECKDVNKQLDKCYDLYLSYKDVAEKRGLTVKDFKLWFNNNCRNKESMFEDYFKYRHIIGECLDKYVENKEGGDEMAVNIESIDENKKEDKEDKKSRTLKDFSKIDTKVTEDITVLKLANKAMLNHAVIYKLIKEGVLKLVDNKIDKDMASLFLEELKKLNPEPTKRAKIPSSLNLDFKEKVSDKKVVKNKKEVNDKHDKRDEIISSLLTILKDMDDHTLEIEYRRIKIRKLEQDLDREKKLLEDLTNNKLEEDYLDH